ncbi:MAG: endo-1,4-beta-xylanase [bacterium]
MATLKDTYPQFLVGAALGGLLPGKYSADELAVIKAQFNQITPENCMKPKNIQPEEGKFDFTQADALVKFAVDNGITITGHCLVWHDACPDWFFRDGDKPASRELVLQRMKTHIQTLVGRYRGVIKGWDVVNEAISDTDEVYWRDTKWHQSIGDDFLEKAFIYAHEADPDVELYYNDYSDEYPVKRAKTLKLIADLQAKGIRIDAVGIQGHWMIDDIPFQEIEDSIVAFHKLGVKVMITELDLDVVERDIIGASISAVDKSVADPYVNGCPPEVLERQAQQYARLFSLFKKHADAITRVTFWGLHDGRSWLNGWPRVRTNHALLFDRQSQPKWAFDAVIAAGQKKP